MSYRRDVIYLYDGSFEGILSAIFDSYYNHEIPLSIEENENVQQGLFCEYITISTDQKKACRVSDSIKNKISQNALQNLYYIFLSDADNKGRLCLDYVRAGYHFGPKIDMHLTVDCVSKTADAVHRVRCEAQRYIEFVRFSELEGGTYYSEIEPKCHVLPLIAPHFVSRLPQMPWMIHDTGRHLCMVYNGKSCYMAPTDHIPNVTYSDSEKYYRRLWKKFYDSIEIKERHNEQCRMTHMPKRFWKHMTEFMPENE